MFLSKLMVSALENQQTFKAVPSLSVIWQTPLCLLILQAEIDVILTNSSSHKALLMIIFC